MSGRLGRRGGRRAAARGQAMAEAALGLIVFCTILILGIHFAEVGYLGLKTQEAANFGVWDATAYKMHDTFASDWSLWRGAIGRADSNLRTRYGDYDGANEGVTKTVSLVFTRAEPMEMSCQAERAVPFMGVTGSGRIAAAGYPDGASGMSCTASARITGLNIPLTFMDRRSRGWFKEEHWTPRPIYMCAAGRATGPNCSGRVSLLLDDWGFSGPDERKNCLLMDGPDCANTGYYRMVNNVFVEGGAGGGLAASRLASLVAGVSPIDENAFFMSFAGSDSPYGPFTDTQVSEHLNVIEWETTPFRYPDNEYARSYARRQPCFLGLRCN